LRGSGRHRRSGPADIDLINRIARYFNSDVSMRDINSDVTIRDGDIDRDGSNYRVIIANGNLTTRQDVIDTIRYLSIYLSNTLSINLSRSNRYIDGVMSHLYLTIYLSSSNRYIDGVMSNLYLTNYLSNIYLSI
jgi:hypothetical protein